VHHARVLMALRLFLLCQYVVQRARQQGVSPDRRLLIDIPTESDIDDDKKNATTLLIERVPLPSEYYDCSSEPMGLTLFKKGIQVFLASSALANTLLGRYKRLYKIFGPVFVVGAIPFYALRHQKAARISTRLLLDDPNVNVIRMAWDVWGESTLSKFVMKLQAPKIPVRKWIYLRLNSNGTEVITSSSRRQLKSDIGLQIFSARPLNSVLQGTWEEASVRLSAEMIAIGLPAKKHVLFYIHGGGFFGRFHSKDIFNLSQWATKLGVVIVYIGKSLYFL
jgi:hypothetical protein